MKLSVIIPVYNRKSAIEEIVNGILVCKESEMEIILVDDGSTDGSGAVCDKLSEQDDRCKVIHKRNGGVSSARNAGIDAAKGDYIYFCDSDDFVFSNVLSESLDLLNLEIDMFIFDYIYKFVKSGETSKSTFKLLSDTTLGREYIINHILSPLVLNVGTDMASACNKFFKRSVIEKYNIRFEENVYKGEDWRFILDYLSVAQTAFYLPEILYEYRLDGTQTESKYKKVIGIHLLGGYKRKFELNKKFYLHADEFQIWKWYAGVIEEIIYIAKNGCNTFELRNIILDDLSQESAKMLLHTKCKKYIENEVSRKYWIYALLIRYHMPFLLKIIAR